MSVFKAIIEGVEVRYIPHSNMFVCDEFSLSGPDLDKLEAKIRKAKKAPFERFEAIHITGPASAPSVVNVTSFAGFDRGWRGSPQRPTFWISGDSRRSKVGGTSLKALNTFNEAIVYEVNGLSRSIKEMEGKRKELVESMQNITLPEPPGADNAEGK